MLQSTTLSTFRNKQAAGHQVTNSTLLVTQSRCIYVFVIRWLSRSSCLVVGVGRPLGVELEAIQPAVGEPAPVGGRFVLPPREAGWPPRPRSAPAPAGSSPTAPARRSISWIAAPAPLPRPGPHFLQFSSFREKISHIGSFCNFLYKWTLGVGAVNCGAELTRLGATDHGAEVPRTHNHLANLASDVGLGSAPRSMAPSWVP